MAQPNSAQTRIRLTRGRLRGRLIHFEDHPDLRPTLNRIREAVGNLIAPFAASHGFLDACAGSGAIGFEALSLGFEPVVLLDTNPRAVNQIRENARRLDVSPTIQVGSAFHVEQSIQPGLWLVYVDPPFRDETFHDRLLTHCGASRHIVPGSVYMAEQRRDRDTAIQPGWELEKTKKYGKIKIEIWRKLDAVAAS